MRAIQLGKWPSTLACTESPGALRKRLVPETDSQRFPFNWSQEQPGFLRISEGHQVFLPVQPRLRTTWPGFIIYNHFAESQVQLLWSVSSCVFVESPEQTCTDIRGQAPLPASSLLWEVSPLSGLYLQLLWSFSLSWGEQWPPSDVINLFDHASLWSCEVNGSTERVTYDRFMG